GCAPTAGSGCRWCPTSWHCRSTSPRCRSGCSPGGSLAGPRREDATAEDDHEVEHDGDHDRGDDAGQDLALEVAAVAVEEHEPEAAEAEGTAHAHEAHGGHRGHS